MENENKKVIEYGTKIYLFCKERWNFYEKQDGAYLPSRHDKKVFKDASKEFGISEKECERWFDFIDKLIAEKLVQEAIKDGKFVELCDEVLGGNGENPWGFQKILKQIHAIFSEIGTKGLKRAYITVAKSDKRYCSSGHYLTEFDFSDVINVMLYENGDVGLADDGNCGYVFEIGNIKSVIHGITESDNELVIAKKMFRLLMNNGNIVTMYFDFKEY